MSPLQWVFLCLLFILYLLFGGGVFMFFEQHRELLQKEEISVLRKDVKEILLLLDREFYNNGTSLEVINALTQAKEGVIHRISSACNIEDLLLDDSEANLEEMDNKIDDKLRWNYYNSVFFAFTVVTTIGYGHLSPVTTCGKIFVMIYALIGIPINTILLSGLGDYFSSRLVKVHQKSKEKKVDGNKCTFILKILFYLIPGMIVFIVIPSGAFVLIEGWTFLDSIYYSFVSLTTIGFGDYVAGMGSGHTVMLWVYKASIIIWITFGLGYLIMILGFISKGMTSKKVRVVIEKRLNTIRSTKEKLSRDIDYMRRVVNELYLMKIKPVYEIEQEENEDFMTKSKRTQSQPCLPRFERRSSSLLHKIGHVPVPPPAMSKPERKITTISFHDTNGKAQCYEIETPVPKLVRRCSESDLESIDREATFSFAKEHHPTPDELLLTVVNALSGDVIYDVLDAVEELNVYEEQAGAELEQAGGFVEDHSNSNRNAEYSSGEIMSWELGAVSESDEEVLLEEDEEEEELDKLHTVVVHGDQKPGQSSSLMDRVTGAIRKISSGNRSPSDGPSRRTSRNEQSTPRKNRKISIHSKNESFERKISQGVGGNLTHSHSYGQHLSDLRTHHYSSHQYFKNPHALALPFNERKTSGLSLSDQRKISGESRSSRISNGSGRSGATQSNPTQRLNFDEMLSNSSSRKITPTSRSPSKISLETTSLAEFLKALDSIHSRLNAKTSSVGHPDNGLHDSGYGNSNSFTSGGGSSGGVGFGGGTSDLNSYPSYQYPSLEPDAPIRKSQRGGRRLSENTHRRRKNGVFQQNLSYVNQSFVVEDPQKKNVEAASSSDSTFQNKKQSELDLNPNHKGF